jgi:E3 ubiquitin-protein ligase RGLG
LHAADRFHTITEVTAALREAGLESSNLIIAIDCTKSNTWTGAKSFGGQCLHAVEPGKLNPYQESLKIIGETLKEFDDDQLIPAFGFGDTRTKDREVFSFSGAPDGVCHGLDDVLRKYSAAIPDVLLSGPTSFAPAIRKACEIVQATQSYHILVIVADGQVPCPSSLLDAFSLAVVLV